jgi:hypothetical protein
MERGNLVSVCLGQRRNGVRTERDVEVDNVSVLCKTAMYMISYRETKREVKIGTHLEVADPGYRGR